MTDLTARINAAFALDDRVTHKGHAASRDALLAIIAEHPAKNLKSLMAVIQAEDFIMVNELYSNTNRDTGEKTLSMHGEIALNTGFIGKVKELEDR